ncbi:hypothetical protein C7R94_23465 [Brevibacillus sp. NRRL NRS-603]|nr:hypothetical protein C7R94_23465 [Brevibacillus sp. NRRL NRS-603]
MRFAYSFCDIKKKMPAHLSYYLGGQHLLAIYIIFVCEQNNEVIGYIHGSPYELLFSDSFVNVLGFVVKEKDRNQGVGSMLIEHLEQWGKKNGFSGMKLLSHPSRIHAHRFYERRGYRFTKDQKNFIKKF